MLCFPSQVPAEDASANRKGPFLKEGKKEKKRRKGGRKEGEKEKNSVYLLGAVGGAVLSSNLQMI